MLDLITPDTIAQAIHVLGAATNQDEEDRKTLAAYDGRPIDFAHEVLGVEILTPRQEDFLESLSENGVNGRVLLLGGHGGGKTSAVAMVLCYAWGVLGSELLEGKRRGCKIIFTAPTKASVIGTAYHQMVAFGAEAARRGYPLPGWGPRRGYAGASSTSVSWKTEDKNFECEGITANPKAGGGIADSMSGRHHSGFQVVVIEEAEGTNPGVQSAVDGLMVARNTATLATTNPTNNFSEIASRVRRDPGVWELRPFPTWDHPNVLERRTVIAGSVGHLAMDEILRTSAFEDRGAVEEVEVDPDRQDFVYALPDRDMPDNEGPRPDGVPGHPDATPHVFRPTSAMVSGQWCGGWIKEDQAQLLFHVGTIRNAMATGTWSEPDRPPDRVGVDCAGTRPPTATPSWGPTAREAIGAQLAYVEDQKGEVSKLRNVDPVRAGAIVLGRTVEIHQGAGTPLDRGKVAAADLVRRYGLQALYIFDQAFGGETLSAVDKLGARTMSVAFGAPPISPELKQYGVMKNRRAEMAGDAAEVFNTGIVSSPYSNHLLQEMEATGSLIPGKDARGGKVLRLKTEVAEAIGRSPDELDTVYLTLASEPLEPFVLPVLV